MSRNRGTFLALLMIWTVAASVAVLAQHASSDPLEQQTGMPAIAGQLQAINGTVVNFDGGPARNARVEVTDTSSGQVVASTYTNNNGQFNVVGLAPRQYEVVATQGLQEARERCELTHGEPEMGLRLRLPNEAAQQASPAGGQYSVSVAQMKAPEKARKAYAKARKALEKANYAEASQLVAAALAADPDYADALTLRGILELDAQKPEEARSDREKAVQLDPANGMGLIALGATYNVLSRFDDARRVLQRGIGLAPAAWQGYFELGKTYIGKGLYQDALAQLGRAGDLAPKSFAALHLVKAHAYLSLKNYDQSMAELQQYLNAEPKGPDADQARDALQRVRAFAAVPK